MVRTNVPSKDKRRYPYINAATVNCCLKEYVGKHDYRSKPSGNSFTYETSSQQTTCRLFTDRYTHAWARYGKFGSILCPRRVVSIFSDMYQWISVKPQAVNNALELH